MQILTMFIGGENMADNLKNEKDMFIGKMKEKAGNLMSDNELELKGKLQGIKGNIGSKLEDMKEDTIEIANDFIDKMKDRKNQ